MKLVVGLGNYGDRYAYTFHNMGFLAVECFADKYGINLTKKMCEALVGEGFVNGEKVIIAQPLTYMNLSGNAVKALMDYYKIGVENLVVLYDDIDLPRFALRVRAKGSAGTHNGMRNIIAMLKTENFARVRIGIGRSEENVPLADYVLSVIPKKDREEFVATFEKACVEVEKFIEGKLF